MSDYFNKLNCVEIKNRYLEKIKGIDVDPYAIPKSEWSSDIEKFPDLSWPDLVMYLVFGTNEFTIEKESFKSFMSLQAYNQFVCGWVRDIVTKEIKGKCVMTCRVLHSLSLSEKPLQPWIILERNGRVISAHCDCMAGLGETCTHVAALLFAMEFYIRKRENKTVTQEKAYWLIPSVRKVPYAEASEIDFTSAKMKKRLLDNTSTVNYVESRKSVQKSTLPPPSNEELQVFYKRLSNSGIKPAVLSIIEPYSTDYIPKASSYHLPSPLSVLWKAELHKKPYKDVLHYCQTVKLELTPRQAATVEENTREQAKTSVWFEQRKGRITASRMKSVCHSDPRLPSQSLIRTICYPELCKFSSAATTSGCEHERIARDTYEQYMKDQGHEQFEIADSGLILDPTRPHIGASPDGVVSCHCCGKGCVEIKCPYCVKDGDFDSAVQDKKHFCLTKSDGNGTLSLRKDHMYYYQVQTQVNISGTEYCDFVVWTENDVHYERILPDYDFWERISRMADQFFKLCILPELTAHFYTSSAAACERLNLEQNTVCYCNSIVSLEEDLRVCDNDQCLIKHFHDNCLGYTGLLLTEFNQKRKKWFCPDCARMATKIQCM